MVSEVVAVVVREVLLLVVCVLVALVVGLDVGVVISQVANVPSWNDASASVSTFVTVLQPLFTFRASPMLQVTA